MDIHSMYGLFQSFFRPKRMAQFVRLFNINAETTILDVGGNQFNWRLIAETPEIVILNIEKPSAWEDGYRNTRFELGDGTKLRFADHSFDVVYSNSVIEHLGSLEMQKRFAAETLRVGRSVYVQTPAREFFIEPHMITPFIHWLPVEMQRRFTRNFTVWGIIARPRQEFVERFLMERRLLTKREFSSLFPGCQILSERFLFFTKSHIAVRVAESI